MKQLIVGLIGETGSGKSTFCSMCTSEQIHSVISGIYGQKGTTKSTKRMTFSCVLDNFDFDKFKQAYEEGKADFNLPLDGDIKLSSFDALTLLDTQGLNDWKSEEEKNSTHDAILQVCDESDIIFVTIPEGGNVVTTNEILQEIFIRYCHKPIIFIYRAQQSRKKLLKKEKAIGALMPFVHENIEQYSKIYPSLGQIINQTEVPAEAGICPLFCVLPNSEELSSDIDVDDRQCDNLTLKEYINDVLQYAINLQELLINEMGNEYVKKNLDIIVNAVKDLCDISKIAKHIEYLTGAPLCRPYVNNCNYAPQDNVEYSWQGGTPRLYPVCGGDYTFAASDIYNNIKNMIRHLQVPVTVKSSLLSVLSSKADDRWTPGSLNLPYASFTRGVQIEWIIDARTGLYNKFPHLFRNVESDDFDNPKQKDFLYKTENAFREKHRDWDKYLEKFYYYQPDYQKEIERIFGNRQWYATVLIYLIIEVLHKIDFCQSLNKKIKEDFDNSAFDSQGKCVLWNNESGLFD